LRGLRLRQASRSIASNIVKPSAGGFASRAVVLSFVAGDQRAEANAGHGQRMLDIVLGDTGTANRFAVVGAPASAASNERQNHSTLCKVTGRSLHYLRVR
jgi:hypothetical protein